MIYFSYVPTPYDELPVVLFENKAVEATITSTSENLPDGAKENVATESTFDFWQPETEDATITFDLGGTEEVDTISIVSHNLGTRSAIITIESSVDNSTWDGEGQLEPNDNSTITLFIEPKSRRYWRVVITNASDIYTIGNIIIGKKLVFPFGVSIPYVPTHMAENVELLISETIEGQFITNRPLRKGLTTDVTLFALDYGFVNEDLEDFRKHFNNGRPFIWCSNPKEFPRDTAYVWRNFNGGELRPVFDISGNLMTLNMELMGFAT